MSISLYFSLSISLSLYLYLSLSRGNLSVRAARGTVWSIIHKLHHRGSILSKSTPSHGRTPPPWMISARIHSILQHHNEITPPCGSLRHRRSLHLRGSLHHRGSLHQRGSLPISYPLAIVLGEVVGPLRSCAFALALF